MQHLLYYWPEQSSYSNWILRYTLGPSSKYCAIHVSLLWLNLPWTPSEANIASAAYSSCTRYLSFAWWKLFVFFTSMSFCCLTVSVCLSVCLFVYSSAVCWFTSICLSVCIDAGEHEASPAQRCCMSIRECFSLGTSWYQRMMRLYILTNQIQPPSHMTMSTL